MRKPFEEKIYNVIMKHCMPNICLSVKDEDILLRNILNHTFDTKSNRSLNITYTMHNKFSNFLCFASLCAHLCAIANNFNCNDENGILGK